MTMYTLPNGKTTTDWEEYKQACLRVKNRLAAALKVSVHVSGSYFVVYEPSRNNGVGELPLWVVKRIVKLAKKAKRK